MDDDIPKDDRVVRSTRYPHDLEAALERARREDGVTFNAEVMHILKQAMEERYGSIAGFADKFPVRRKKSDGLTPLVSAQAAA